MTLAEKYIKLINETNSHGDINTFMESAKQSKNICVSSSRKYYKFILKDNSIYYFDASKRKYTLIDPIPDAPEEAAIEEPNITAIKELSTHELIKLIDKYCKSNEKTVTQDLHIIKAITDELVIRLGKIIQRNQEGL